MGSLLWYSTVFNAFGCDSFSVTKKAGPVVFIPSKSRKAAFVVHSAPLSPFSTAVALCKGSPDKEREWLCIGSQCPVGMEQRWLLPVV